MAVMRELKQGYSSVGNTQTQNSENFENLGGIITIDATIEPQISLGYQNLSKYGTPYPLLRDENITRKVKLALYKPPLIWK